MILERVQCRNRETPMLLCNKVARGLVKNNENTSAPKLPLHQVVGKATKVQ
jgi:hypothetical protein